LKISSSKTTGQILKIFGRKMFRLPYTKIAKIIMISITKKNMAARGGAIFKYSYIGNLKTLLLQNHFLI